MSGAIKPPPPIELKCPECGKWSARYRWEKSVIYGCELCDEHEALVCPECLEEIDLIVGEDIEERNV